MAMVEFQWKEWLQQSYFKHVLVFIIKHLQNISLGSELVLKARGQVIFSKLGIRGDLWGGSDDSLHSTAKGFHNRSLVSRAGGPKRFFKCAIASRDNLNNNCFLNFCLSFSQDITFSIWINYLISVELKSIIWNTWLKEDKLKIITRYS